MTVVARDDFTVRVAWHDGDGVSRDFFPEDALVIIGPAPTHDGELEKPQVHKGYING